MLRIEYLVTRALHTHRGALSEATLARQKQEGRQMMRQLRAAGYRLDEPRQLRGKSTQLLLDVWAGRVADPTTGQVRILSPGTQAVRLATLRKICRLAGKPGLVPKGNLKAGLEPRERVPQGNVAWRLTDAQLARVSDPHMRLALRLQAQFGLRKKEAILLDARRCHRGDILVIDRGSKGGVRREVPVVTAEQRQLLEEVKIANGTTPQGTLVAGPTLAGALKSYKSSMREAGLTRGHGLRHQYAQDRYRELTRQADPRGVGWACPKAGGPPTSRLSKDDLAIDAAVREQLTHELGHGRVAVVAVYIGR